MLRETNYIMIYIQCLYSPQYSFVTPLTSMVVTKPQDPDKKDGDVTNEETTQDDENMGNKRGVSQYTSVHL